MNNNDNPIAPLTHEEHRIMANDILLETKNLSTNTFKIIGEGIENKNYNLETILLTLVWFDILGESYFKGNFADRGRFESLVCPF